MSSPEILSCKLCWGCKNYIFFNTATNISLLSRMNTETSCQGTEQYPGGILLPPKFHTTLKNVMESIRKMSKPVGNSQLFCHGLPLAYLLSIESDNAAGIYQRRCCLLSTLMKLATFFQNIHGSDGYPPGN